MADPISPARAILLFPALLISIAIILGIRWGIGASLKASYGSYNEQLIEFVIFFILIIIIYQLLVRYLLAGRKN